MKNIFGFLFRSESLMRAPSPWHPTLTPSESRALDFQTESLRRSQSRDYALARETESGIAFDRLSPSRGGHASSLESDAEGSHGPPAPISENYVVCSKEADCGGDPEKGIPHDRHRWRGAVTVWYIYDVKRCSVCFSFSEDMVARALGLKAENTWESTERVLEKLIA